MHAVPRGYLAAKPGAGKTAVALAYICERMGDHFDVQKTLVVAPKRVVPQWGFEAGRWEFSRGMSFTMYAGLPDERVARLSDIKNVDITVVSFEFLSELLGAFPKKRDWPFQQVIFDEASRLRNGGRQGSQTWKAINTISRKTDSRIHLLSGSPRPGTAHELYGPVAILDGGERLGKTLAAFRAAYLQPNKTDRDGRVLSWRLRPGLESSLYSTISDLYFAVSPDLGIHVNEVDHYVSLPSKVNTMIERLRGDQVLDIEDLDDEWHEVTAGHAGTLVAKIHQIEQGFVFDDRSMPHRLHDEKFRELEELIEQIDRPVLVCPWYWPDTELLLALPGAADLSTDKGLALAKAGKVQIGILHPGSAGHGIDGLQQHFSDIVFYTCPRSFELYDQTIKRIARSGQSQTVIVHRLIAGDVDRRVAAELERKEAEQEAFFEFLKRA
jgi:hypothetical protein